MLDNLIDSSDDRSDTKPLAMSRQIVIPSGDIPNPGDNASSHKEDGDFLDDRPQEQ